MISTNYENENDNTAEYYFNKFAANSRTSLIEKEFNQFLKIFLMENKKEDLLEYLIQENIFNTYLKKGTHEMDKESFFTAFNELTLLIKSGENDNALESDFKFEEEDFQF